MNHSYIYVACSYTCIKLFFHFQEEPQIFATCIPPKEPQNVPQAIKQIDLIWLFNIQKKHNQTVSWIWTKHGQNIKRSNF